MTEGYVHMYYQHQYDRLNILEKYALTMTQVIVTLSVAALAFGLPSEGDVSSTKKGALCVSIVALNTFAVLYIWRTGAAMLVHQKRAKKTLARYAPDLYELDGTVPGPRRNVLPRRAQLQIGIHVMLSLISVLAVLW